MAKVATKRELRPMGDRVLVRAKQKDDVRKSGIVIPDTAREKPQEGEVVAVGPGRILDNGERLTVGIKVGQSVLYSKYAGTELTLDDEELLIFREPDVLAIVTD
jgi:chaperonin GroES